MGPRQKGYTIQPDLKLGVGEVDGVDEEVEGRARRVEEDCALTTKAQDGPASEWGLGRAQRRARLGARGTGATGTVKTWSLE